MAMLKPTTPLHTPNKGPMKPASPLRPKTAPKTPISHPQRRWRFQTTAPPRLRHPDAAPMGGGASPRHPWAISVTNVVKPEQFEPPCECSCYKRRQSASKNLDFQRNSRRIDDVCNNTQRRAPKSQHDKPDHIGGPEGQAAAPVGRGGAWPNNEPTHRATDQRPGPTGVEGAGGSGGPGCGARGRRGLAGLRDNASSRPHRCEGRRRVRRARAGFEARRRTK